MADETINVSTTEDLYDALSTATGGETILLAGGTYDKIGLWRGSGFSLEFPDTVTIKSADLDNPAVIHELKLTGVSNLTFDGLVFDYVSDAGATISKRDFAIRDSSDIVIRNSVFDGDLAHGVDVYSDGFATGHGLTVGRGSTNVLIESNEIFGFKKGIGIGESEHVTIRGNDIHSMRIDGITSTRASNLIIENNHIHDFARSLNASDHADMIQFWTTGSTEQVSDIIIRDNVLDIGDGDVTHSILMGNQVVGRGAGQEMFFKNVEITGNVIMNSHLNGIVVGASDGLTIADNVLVNEDGAVPRDLGARAAPRIMVDERSIDVTIDGNMARKVPSADGKDGWSVENNTLVQNTHPDEAEFYSSAIDLVATTPLADLYAARYDLGEAVSDDYDGISEDAPDDGLTSPLENGFMVDIVGAVDEFGERARFEQNGAIDEATGDLLLAGREGALYLGKLKQFQDQEELGVSIEYSIDDAADRGQLLNNHGRLAVALDEGSLILRVATENDGMKRYVIDDVEHEAGSDHDLTILLDRTDDRLQVIHNGDVVLDDTGTDFKQHDGLHNWGWTLGNRWHESIDGTVSDLTISTDVVFA